MRPPENRAHRVGWLTGPPGDGPLDALAADVLEGLASDDPAAGIEVDLGHGQARVESVGTRLVHFDEAARAAVLQGLGANHPLAGRLTGPGSDPVHGARPAQDPIRIVLRLAPALGAWLTRRGVDGLDTARDGSAQLTVETTDAGEMLPWLLRLGPRVEVVEPRSVRLALAAAAADLAERYRRPPPATE